MSKMTKNLINPYNLTILMLVLPKEYLQCRLCGHYYRRLTNSHLKKHHNMTLEKYKEMFPDAPTITQYIKEATANPKSSHPMWKGGISPKVYRDPILLRDNYTCQLCKRIDSHCVHIIDHRVFPPNRPDNLITLCRSCLNQSRSKKHYVSNRQKLKEIARKKERLKEKAMKKLIKNMEEKKND